MFNSKQGVGTTRQLERRQRFSQVVLLVETSGCLTSLLQAVCAVERRIDADGLAVIEGWR